MKHCSGCNINKSLDSFNVRKQSKDGLCSRCRDCLMAKSKAYYRNNPEKHKYRMLEQNYGVTEDFYKHLLDLQENVCAICGGVSTDGKSLHVDHDHATGLVRGLLCNLCNMGLGKFKDDPKRLAEAIKYLDIKIELEKVDA